MNEKDRNRHIVNVARELYDALGRMDWNRVDVEELGQKVADKVPFEKIGRGLAVKLVGLAVKAAEAAGALYQSGADAPLPAPNGAAPAPAEGPVKPDEVLPPGAPRSEAES